MRKLLFFLTILLFSLSLYAEETVKVQSQPEGSTTSDTKAEAIKGEAPIIPQEKKTETSITTTDSDASKNNVSQTDNNKKLEAENKKTEWIKKTIQYGIHDDRIEAIKSTLSLKNESNKNAIIKLLDELMPEELNPDVKRTAITIVSELKSSSSGQWIIDALNSNSEDVKIAAIYAIERLQLTQANTTLINSLKEQDFTKNSNYTEALIRTLGKLKATEVKDFIIEKIKDVKTTDNLRQLMILFLGDIEDISSKDFLLSIVEDKEEDTTLRSYAAVALAKIGAKDTAPAIYAIIKEIDSYPLNKRKEYYSFSMYCTAALVKMGDSNAIPRLMESLRSNNAVVRLKAIEMMKELKDKRTIDILKYKMKYDPSPKVQKAAKDALKEMGEEVDESQ